MNVYRLTAAIPRPPTPTNAIRTVSMGSHANPSALTCPGARGGALSSIIPFLITAGTDAGTFLSQEASVRRPISAAKTIFFIDFSVFSNLAIIPEVCNKNQAPVPSRQEGPH